MATNRGGTHTEVNKAEEATGQHHAGLLSHKVAEVSKGK